MFTGWALSRCCREVKSGALEVTKYKCNVCGWVYDPELGDPDGHIPPGTPFEKLPDNWQCPMCGAAKADFEKAE